MEICSQFATRTSIHSLHISQAHVWVPGSYCDVCTKSYVKSLLRCLLAMFFHHHLYLNHMSNLSSLSGVCLLHNKGVCRENTRTVLHTLGHIHLAFTCFDLVTLDAVTCDCQCSTDLSLVLQIPSRHAHSGYTFP